MSNDEPALRPVCFMVMPFGRKRVEGARSDAAPAEVDFNALWDLALRPAIEDAGYLAVRADQDPGSVIVKDMLERLAFADLVLADLSLPNGNVYYEVGLRHVARETHCVLLAADWSRQLFDVDQFRTVRYPMRRGEVEEADAAEIKRTVVKAINQLRDGKTPFHEFISADVSVDQPDRSRSGVFRDEASRLNSFQATARAIRLQSDPTKRKEEIRRLSASVEDAALQIPEVAVEMLRLIRDGLGWAETMAFIERLPDSICETGFVREQRALAISGLGEPEQAIAELEQLVRGQGVTPERLGLIGGRYKRLWLAAREERIASHYPSPSPRERTFLDRAIQHYTDGMRLDLNDYYCAGNLPTLLRSRGEKGDSNRAVEIDYVVIAACERAIELRVDDEWTRPTLIGAAFRAGDLGKANELADRVEADVTFPYRWQLGSTLADLKLIVDQADDEDVRKALQIILDRLLKLHRERG